MAAKETTLITGASSGIGLELAKLFAADGSDLVLVARRRQSLEALAAELTALSGVKVTVLPADLSRLEERIRLFEGLASLGISIDVLVNNAGFGARGAFADLPLDRQLDMIQLNVTALTHLTGLLLPGMKERGRGGVLNVASTAAFQAGPYMAVYYATKAFVLHFTEALADELRNTNLTISCLAPGPTHTEFASQAGATATRLFSAGVMDASTVAEIGYRGFRKGRLLVIAGGKNRFLAFANRLVPRSFARRVVEMIQA